MLTPIQEFFHSGGPLMYPLLVSSVVALAIIIERGVFWLRFWLRRDPKLRRELIGLYVHADNVRRTRDEIAMVLADFVRAPDEPTGQVIRAERIVRQTRRHLGLLGLIASISTSLGLLGTVIGVSLALKSISLDDPGSLAGALAIALNTTVFGLIIFLPAYMFWSFFNHLSTLVGLEIEEAMEQIKSGARIRREKLARGVAVTQPAAASPAPAPAHAKMATAGAAAR